MKILTTSYGGSHVKTIEPILEELVVRGHECLYMPQTVASINPSLKVKRISFLDYANIKDPQVLDYGKKLVVTHHNSYVMDYEASIIYLETIFKELVSQIGENLAWEKYNEIGLRACNPVNYMQNVIKIECPDFVFASNAPRMERAFLNAAVAMGIPNICVIDFQGLREIDWLKSSLSCDSIAVGSLVTVDRLIENGGNPNSIYLTGSPLFEEINNSKLIQSALKWRYQNKIEQCKVVLFIEQPDFKFPNLPNKIRAKISEIFLKNNYKFVTRFHPSRSREDLAEYPEEKLSPPSQMVEEIVHACDVCVMMTSTVGWMALMANKPLVVVNVSSTSQYLNIGEGDGALQISSIDELENGINLVLTQNPISKKLSENRLHLPKFDNSIKKIADLIEENYWKKC
jgi:hypothetical protein